jgi:lipoprotein-anchoring transpeptidase ErfK/SrfK
MAVRADALLDLVRDPGVLPQRVRDHCFVLVQLARPFSKLFRHRLLRLVIVTPDTSPELVKEQSRSSYCLDVRRRLFFLVLAVSAGVVTGQAAGTIPRGPVITPSREDPGKPKAAERCRPGSVRRMATVRMSHAAVVRKRAIAFRSPGRSELARFGPTNANGVPTVFAVLAKRVDRHCGVSWYRVKLPMKPNGITGWIRPYAVNVVPLATRIQVDLSERRVTLFVRGRRVLSARAAIGTPQTPTPTGRFYVNQRLIPYDTSGPFGPGAIGISAFSEVLTGWTQGGPIAIHGTNRPELIGRAVSNGCIRIHNDKLVRLFRRALAGTPVTVRA